MKKLFLLFALALAPLALFAQNVRVSIPFPSISSQYPPLLQANIAPNLPVLAVCNYPANATPCTNYATTYDSTGAACSNGAQDTPDPQPSSCQSTGDAQGNLGFWIPPGTYDYTVCIQNTVSCFGPYTFSAGSGGSAVTPGLYPNGINLQHGSTYTLQASDSGKLIVFDDDANITLTVSGAFSAGYQVGVMYVGCCDGFTLEVNSASIPVDETTGSNVIGDVSSLTGFVLVSNGSQFFTNGEPDAYGSAVASSSNESNGELVLASGTSTSQNNPYLATITNVTISSNVLTLTYTSGTIAPDAGGSLTLSGLTTDTFLNGQTVQVTAFGANSITANFTHSDVSNTDTGTIAQQFFILVTYAGLGDNHAPASAPTNPGTLWTQIASDFKTFEIKSTSNTDASAVQYRITPE